MRVHICAVGRLRHSCEKTLIEDYCRRFDKTGRGLALGPMHLHEVEDNKASGRSAEAELLSRSIPKGSLVCSLDERGKLMSSPEFATLLSQWRDQGQSDVSFIIGGADGLHSDLRAEATASLSFGKMVWPHIMARLMLTEQLYRAASILAGTPYHRV
jgi:23S rRNA (pseudouridine1915-N3)-methyltransferase